MTLGSLSLALVLSLDPAVELELDAGRPRVAQAMRVAAPAYIEAVLEAVELVDPLGELPWLAHELWRICLREARCGQYGSPGLHEGDAWTGRASYRRAVERGRLDPETCPEHRLGPEGPRVFGTRGGWGVNAARGLRFLEGCRGPSALDDPRAAAVVAARMLATCTRGPRPCSCSERAAMWTGRGRLASRPLLSWLRKSRASTVAVQCGDQAARAYVLAQLLGAPWRAAQRLMRAVW